LLHLEYLEQHPDGYRYTQFCEVYRRWLQHRGLSMRQVHRGGEKCFVDEQPIFSAIEVIAAHCDSCAASCSTTIRTARDRTSGENLVGLGMAPSSQGLEPPGNPARFSLSYKTSANRLFIQ